MKNNFLATRVINFKWIFCDNFCQVINTRTFTIKQWYIFLLLYFLFFCLFSFNWCLKYFLASGILTDGWTLVDYVPYARRKLSTRLKLGYWQAITMTMCSEGDVITQEHAYVDILNTAVIWLTTRVSRKS